MGGNNDDREAVRRAGPPTPPGKPSGREAFFGPPLKSARPAAPRVFLRFGRSMQAGVTEPVTAKVRAMLVGCAVVVALVLGFAIASALLQFRKAEFEGSAWVGRYACGAGLFIKHVPASRRGLRIACVDAEGREIGGPNNGAYALIALPFMVLIGVPAIALAFRVKRVSRHRSRR
jgi:hypothetical protein